MTRASTPRLARLATVLVALLTGWLFLTPSSGMGRAFAEAPSPSPTIRLLGNLEDQAIAESSGIMASRVQPGWFWTHNDSGDGPYLYLFDQQGKKRGTWLIAGATSRDAEDCAAGPGPDKGRSYLYFGDIGDNDSARNDCVVWRVPEPEIKGDETASDREHPRPTAPAVALPFSYPDGPHDCEALLVHPVTGDIYLVTKERRKAKSAVFKFPKPGEPGQRQVLIKVGEIDLGLSPLLPISLVTGGDIAPDGKRLILRDYFQLYEYELPSDVTDFDQIWAQKPRGLPSPPVVQGEAVCYGADGRSLYLTSEQLPTPLYEETE